MSAKFLTIALIVAASASQSPAFAQYRGGEVGEFSIPSAASQLTRAEVRAEVLQARSSGTLPSFGEGADTARVAIAANPNVPQFTRAQIRGEYLQAALAGTLPELGEGADIGYATVAGAQGQRTRAEVHAEVVQAIRDGLTVGGEI